MSNSAALFGGGASGGAPVMWAAGTPYAQGNFAISPTDFQVYIRKVAGTTAGDPQADATNWQPFGQTAIKSIQRGLIVSNGTATISAVNTAKSVLYQLGSADFSGTGIGAGYVVLTNSTTINSTGGGGSGTNAFEVVEYY